MPSCPTHSLIHNSGIASSRTVAQRLTAHRARQFKRFASSTTTILSTNTAEQELAGRPEPLTLLHKTRNLLPRVLGDARSSFQQYNETGDILDSVLSGAYDDLSIASERPAKILGR